MQPASRARTACQWPTLADAHKHHSSTAEQLEGLHAAIASVQLQHTIHTPAGPAAGVGWSMLPLPATNPAGPLSWHC
jgi:hypothetical protein